MFEKLRQTDFFQSFTFCGYSREDEKAGWWQQSFKCSSFVCASSIFLLFHNAAFAQYFIQWKIHICFQTVRSLKICRISGPDVMSGRALWGTSLFETVLTGNPLYHDQWLIMSVWPQGYRASPLHWSVPRLLKTRIEYGTKSQRNAYSYPGLTWPTGLTSYSRHALPPRCIQYD